MTPAPNPRAWAVARELEAEACAAIDAAVERANAKLEQLIDPAEVAALGRTRR